MFVSIEIKKHFFLNVFLFIFLILLIVSSILLLDVPKGYQNGRNLRYGKESVPNHQSWMNMHEWMGFIFSALLIVHLIFHWKWIEAAAKRFGSREKKNNAKDNTKVFLNMGVDAIAAIFFFLCLFSGIVLFLSEGGRGKIAGLFFFFTRRTWLFIHVGAGLGMLIMIMGHLFLHWNWLKKTFIKIYPRLPSLEKKPN